MPNRKNILKKFNYDTLQIEKVNFFHSHFDGNRMFVLAHAGIMSSHVKAKSMDNMDKRYNGHVWIMIMDKKFVFKMFKVGLGGGVKLLKLVHSSWWGS